MAKLQVGQTASLRKTVTDADVLLHVAVSLDANPIHIDAEAARREGCRDRLVPGMLVAGLISAVIGTKLPGPGTFYLDQSLRFVAPVWIGETVAATVEIVSLNIERSRVRLRTTCRVGDRVVIDGEAYVQAPASLMFP